MLFGGRFTTPVCPIQQVSTYIHIHLTFKTIKTSKYTIYSKAVNAINLPIWSKAKQKQHMKKKRIA